MDCSLPGSSVHGNFPGKSTGVGCHFLLQGIFPDPETEPGSPAFQGDALTSVPPGSPLDVYPREIQLNLLSLLEMLP